jgi:hypothetical protein
LLFRIWPVTRRTLSAGQRRAGSRSTVDAKQMVRPVYESPVSGMYIAPQQFASIAGVSTRMDDGEGYEFIYVALLWSKVCPKRPSAGGAWANCVARAKCELGGRRSPLPTLKPALKTADL